MEQLGRYTITHETSVGDVANVYRAYHMMNGGIVRPIAIKKILPSLARQPEMVSLIVEEGRITSNLEHANVLQILDMDQIDGHWFIVTERVLGQDLGTVVKKAKLRGVTIDPHTALYVTIQLLQGLSHAHERTDADGNMLGIVHRDVSPSNVLIGYGGEVKLTGFGYARIRGRNVPPQPGGAKPRYTHMSPEQALGSDVDHRSDVFSAGLILYELLAGIPAYEARSDLEALARAQRGQVRTLLDLAPHVGTDLREVVERALVFDRKHRHPSASVFRDELARILYVRDPTYAAHRITSLMAQVLGDEASEDRHREKEDRAMIEGRKGGLSAGSIPSMGPVAPGMPSRSGLHPGAMPAPPPQPVMQASSSSSHAMAASAGQWTPPPPPPPAALPPPQSLPYSIHKTQPQTLMERPPEDLLSSLEPGMVPASAQQPPPPPTPAPRPALKPMSTIDEINMIVGKPPQSSGAILAGASVPMQQPHANVPPPTLPATPTAKAAAQSPMTTVLPSPDAYNIGPTSPPTAFEEKRFPFGKIALGLVLFAVLGLAGFALSSEKNMRLVQRKLRAAFIGRQPGGILTIESLPSGATVTIDGETSGRKTPLVVENLESGMIHDLALDLEGESTVTSTVEIKAGQKRTITVVFKDAVIDLSVKSEPVGAEIWVDNRSVALTPGQVMVRVGKEINLRVNRVGYVEHIQTITPERGKNIALEIKLEKTQALLDQEAAETEAIEAAEEEAAAEEGAPKKKKKKKADE